MIRGNISSNLDMWISAPLDSSSENDITSLPTRKKMHNSNLIMRNLKKLFRISNNSISVVMSWFS